MADIIRLILNKNDKVSTRIFTKQLKKFKQHYELVFAILSGLLILTAWFFKSEMNHTLWITLNSTAFFIGGYAKAKEGLEETIESKKLNVELLMIFAAIGSASIGYWTEGAILIFIFALSGALETYTNNKSEREISSLMNLQPEQALVVTNGQEKFVDVGLLNIGDKVLVKAGERVPADGTIIKGQTTLDESALTGESLPVNKSKDTPVFAGTININGTITIEVTKRNTDTLFQKIIELVKDAQSEKSPSQLFIERFESTYVKVVLLTVFIMMFLPHFLFGWSWTDTIYRAMILLVVASPCALVASIMPATLAAITTGAKNGVLFKGGVHVENLSHVKAIAFDKTGTLTNGQPKVTDTYFASDVDKNDMLAIVGSMEKESNHPLAQAIVGFCKGTNRTYEVEEFQDKSGNGITARVNNQTWKIGKAEFVGEDNAYTFHAGIAHELAKEAKSLVFVANEERVVGLFALKDSLRPDTIAAIDQLKKNGIHTVMLTGDNQITAKAIATEAGIDNYIANCLPEHKVTNLKALKKEYGNVAMIGDGINDAPALATANIGIAMGAGTDVALETADIVLMKNKLSKLANAITLSNRMNNIVKQNVLFSIGVILLLIATNFLQLLDLPLGVIGHEGSTILVILNGLRLLKG